MARRWEDVFAWLHYSAFEDRKGLGPAELYEALTELVPASKLEEFFHDAMEQDGYFEELPPAQDPEGSPKSAGGLETWGLTS